MIAEEVGWNGDSLEAEAFGFLAVKSILGQPYTFKETTGVKKIRSGGVLYYHFKD